MPYICPINRYNKYITIKIKKTMEVSKKDLRRWKSKHKHGDATRISQLYNINRPSISRGLNGGGVDKKTIDAINDYYQ